MWMCYSAERWPQAINVQTAIKRLIAIFDDLELEAMLEQNKLGSINTQEELKILEEKYEKGAELCREYLNEKMSCIGCLVFQLTQCGLEGFLHDLVKYAGCQHCNKDEKYV